MVDRRGRFFFFCGNAKTRLSQPPLRTRHTYLSCAGEELARLMPDGAPVNAAAAAGITTQAPGSRPGVNGVATRRQLITSDDCSQSRRLPGTQNAAILKY
ncbi:hypothetical protein TcWFU_010495 [Taenia crassiceps]|uniref:Uncharacterized protein n=1 Tax=Taenia crassiceps TaxID=6207 RepID=A0ABR4Q8I5_9CEST